MNPHNPGGGIPRWTTLAQLFAFAAAQVLAAELRLGMVGLDTGHVIEFAKILHDPAAPTPQSGVGLNHADTEATASVVCASALFDDHSPRR
jgi:hypothetical protein